MWTRRFSHGLLPIVLVLCALWGSVSGQFAALDRFVFDRASAFRDGADVTHSVVIAIDDQSLAAIGRWPWSRAIHAQLITKLQQAQSGPVVVDVIFADPDLAHPADDKQLAAAMAQHGQVFLPVMIEPLSESGQLVEVLPHAPFLYASQGTGHVHIACDDDGICRSVYLREGLGGAHWPHIALAVATQHDPSLSDAIPGLRDPQTLSPSPYWVHRDFENFIPFSAADQLPVVSAVDVLAGRVPDSVFRDKTVYIGATAAGMNDVITTPAGRRAGVLVTALVDHHLRAHSLITRVASPWLWMSLAVLLCAAMISASFLGPGQFFLAMLALAGTLLVGQVVALLSANRWLPLMAFVVMIAIYYPLWSWLRLELAMRFLQRSLQAQGERPVLPLASLLVNAPRHRLPWWQGRDVIARTIEKLDNANRLQESTYLLLQQTFASLQEACCIFDHEGQCHLVNKLMNDYFPEWEHQTMASLGDLLKLPDGLRWQKAMAGLLARGEGFSCEATHAAEATQKYLFVQAQSCHFVVDGRTIALGILTVTDITALKASEHARRETLAFISHDLRSPLVSILSLIKNHTSDTPAEATLLSNIEHYANRNLAYTESLLQLNRAEQLPKARFHLVDLQAVMDDAYWQVLPFAEEQHCPIQQVKSASESWVMGDFELLQRMLVNVLSNAVKYGATEQGIVASLTVTATNAIVTVEDFGPGLQAPLETLLASFSRPLHNRQSGAGLGLYFVNTVAVRHGGELRATTKESGGCVMSITLPLTELPAFD